MKYWAKIAHIISVGVCASSFDPAFAASVSGIVRSSGSELNTTAIVTDESGKSLGEICAGLFSTRALKLAGMTLEFQGEWKPNNPKAKNRCFEPADFRVLKTSSGRDARVGVLKKSGSAYSVVNESGMETPLSSVPPGLRRLVAKRVIIDSKAADDGSANQKVITYAEFP